MKIKKILLVSMAVPTIDLGGLVRIVQKFVIITALLKIAGFLIDLFKKPAFLVALMATIAYYPEAIQWVMYQLGLLQVKVIMLILNALMPQVWGAASVEGATEVADIFNSSVHALPSEVVQVIQALDIISLLGMVFTTLTIVFLVKFYYAIMDKMG